jgi:hypothetical protein
MTDKGIVWIVAGAVTFWLAILFPDATGAVLLAFKHFGQSAASHF